MNDYEQFIVRLDSAIQQIESIDIPDEDLAELVEAADTALIAARDQARERI